MAITESRIKTGTLKLGTAGAFDMSCQVTNVRVGSAYADDGDALEVLCGDTVPPGRKLDVRTLAGTFVQDWTAAAGMSVVDYLWDNELEELEFEYKPNGTTGKTISGIVRIEVPAETYGGDVNTRLTSEFEWSIIGDVTRTDAVVMAAGVEADADSEAA